jgi:hypothetical protein
MGENVLCDDCLKLFIIEWRDGQYELESLIKKWFSTKSRATKNEIKQFILSYTVPKCICETWGKFFFPPRPGKYCLAGIIIIIFVIIVFRVLSSSNLLLSDGWRMNNSKFKKGDDHYIKTLWLKEELLEYLKNILPYGY